MASILWRRQFTPRHVLLNTDATLGSTVRVTLVMTDAGYPRIKFPLAGSQDLSVVVPIGMLGDYLPPADLRVRVRLHSQPGATEDYTLQVRFMARRPGLDGAAELFAATTTQFPTQSLTGALLQDVEASIPAGAARDNAQDGDSLYMLLNLDGPGGLSSNSLLVEMIDIWQEIP